MNNLIYTLIADLKVPQQNNYLLFPLEYYGLSNFTRVNPLKKIIEVELIAVDKNNVSKTTVLNRYLVTETGEKTNEVLNQEEITANNAAYEQLNRDWYDLRNLYNQTQNQWNEVEDKESPEAVALYEELEALNLEINTVSIQIRDWEFITPDYKYVNKYDDVIGYFKNDGSLTPEGLEWAKTITFMGRPIGEYIV